MWRWKVTSETRSVFSEERRSRNEYEVRRIPRNVYEEGNRESGVRTGLGEDH